MTMPVQDVLEGDDRDERTRPSRALVVAVAVAAVLAVALAAAVERAHEPGAAGAVPLEGRVWLDEFSAEPVELASGGVEERDETATGRVRLLVADGELVGAVGLEYDASISPGAGRGYALHAWGDVRLELGPDTCRGSFAWSNLEEPLDGGGALQVRCDDGATLAARLAATSQPSRGMVLDLHDGWYRAGDDA